MVKSIWFVFTIHILEMNLTSHISIPSLKITWVGGLKRRTASLSVYLMRGWAGKPEDLFSLPAAGIVQIIQELLAFDTVLKAAITEVETTHSIKIRNLSCTVCGTGYWRGRLGDPHPHMTWCGFNVSLHISCCGKSKTKNLLPFLFSIKCSHTHKTHTLWIWGDSFSSIFLKIKRHQYPFIYVLKVSIIITEQKWHLWWSHKGEEETTTSATAEKLWLHQNLNILLVWFYWFSRVPWRPWSTTGKGNGSQRSYGCFQCLLAMWLAIIASSITFSNKRLKETDGILLHACMSMASGMAWSYTTVKEVLE